MKATHRTWIASGLAVLALLHPRTSGAQPEASVFVAVDGALSGADHFVELHRDELRVDSTWVLSASILEGSEIPLSPPLPRAAHVESDRLVAVHNAQREIVALRPTRTLSERERVAIRVSLPRDLGLGLATLPIPTPRARSIQRVRFGRGVRFEVGEQTSMSVAAGIQVGRGISHRARRRVDVALDGPHAHRRVGALYVLADSDGIEGQLRSASEQRAGLMVFAAGLFLVAAAGVYQMYRRAQRAVERERVDAYLASACAPEEARQWGITDPTRARCVVSPADALGSPPVDTREGEQAG